MLDLKLDDVIKIPNYYKPKFNFWQMTFFHFSIFFMNATIWNFFYFEVAEFCRVFCKGIVWKTKNSTIQDSLSIIKKAPIPFPPKMSPFVAVKFSYGKLSKNLQKNISYDFRKNKKKIIKKKTIFFNTSSYGSPRLSIL